MSPILFPILCFLAGCITAMFTRSKMYAIVFPGLVFLLFSIISFITSAGLGDFVEGVVFVSPFIFAGFFMAMMYAGIGAFIAWQIRGARVSPGVHPPSKALVRYLRDPISVRRYCERYGVTQAEVEAAIAAGKMKAYSERGVDYVEDQPPPTLSPTKET